MCVEANWKLRLGSVFARENGNQEYIGVLIPIMYDSSSYLVFTMMELIQSCDLVVDFQYKLSI